MPNAANEAHIGEYAALTGDAPLAAIIGNRVYDHQAPDGAVFPYIVLGSLSDRDVSGFGGDGSDIGRTSHIWTRLPGSRANASQLFEIWDHMRRIYRAGFVVAAHGVAFADASLSLTLTDPDDPERLTLHGVVRTLLTTEAT